jgi:hypothetical protein
MAMAEYCKYIHSSSSYALHIILNRSTSVFIAGIQLIAVSAKKSDRGFSYGKRYA